MLTYGFLANGGILEIAHVKVYPKGHFLLLFCATDELTRPQASKRSTNLEWKTLAEQEEY
ncbi:hypothetical protein DXF85_01615 [Citrobacter pasteurii]|uniref:Uncharacterized protein n=1 Tax=Citrobacter pasteurii TaxID=1563222 RepID=A0A6N6K7V0_9ENTR|nr:hypothetical protein DXF85_01615 [Citrobacter pasteurii]